MQKHTIMNPKQLAKSYSVRPHLLDARAHGWWTSMQKRFRSETATKACVWIRCAIFSIQWVKANEWSCSSHSLQSLKLSCLWKARSWELWEVFVFFILVLFDSLGPIFLCSEISDWTLTEHTWSLCWMCIMMKVKLREQIRMWTVLVLCIVCPLEFARIFQGGPVGVFSLSRCVIVSVFLL